MQIRRVLPTTPHPPKPLDSNLLATQHSLPPIPRWVLLYHSPFAALTSVTFSSYCVAALRSGTEASLSIFFVVFGFDSSSSAAEFCLVE